jgi:hypothetical protein
VKAAVEKPIERAFDPAKMSDLITMQPNLNIPLYIVAPKRAVQQGIGRGEPPDLCIFDASYVRGVPIHRFRDVARAAYPGEGFPSIQPES